MFDLNAAVKKWCKTLGEGGKCTSEEVEELEEHLREQIGQLQSVGLSDEESFLVALRRLGEPDQISDEFAKLDPFRIWKRRLIWMIIGAVAWTAAWPLYQVSWRTIGLFVYRLPIPAGAQVPLAVGTHLGIVAIVIVAGVRLTGLTLREHRPVIIRWLLDRNPAAIVTLLFAVCPLVATFTRVLATTTSLQFDRSPSGILMPTWILSYELAARLLMIVAAATITIRLSRSRSTEVAHT